MSELYLTPVTATIMFIAGVLAGYQYRRVWKTEGPAWQAWVFGLVAASCLLSLAFLPMKVS